MRKVVNPQTALYAIGIAQPVSALELQGFIAATFPETDVVSLEDIESFLRDQLKANRIVSMLHQDAYRYSLTEHGNIYLAPSLRKVRDKLRAYLLKAAHKGKFVESRAGRSLGLVGASPTNTFSTPSETSEAKKLGPRSSPHGSRVLWPRSLRQFQLGTGPATLARDTFPKLVSFASPRGLSRARASLNSVKFDYVGIGLCLGLSSALISRMAFNPGPFYREFPLRKKGGGSRTIRSPRVFLKVVQWFLAEFVLTGLPTSSAVHSYRSDRSIVTNARVHEKQALVANIDIKDFFGSITKTRIKTLLQRSGFSSTEAGVISRLVTVEDGLPQGAPTSPLLSNAILAEFDAQMSKYAKERSIKYTRYADDMTLSGESRKAISSCISYASRRLGRYGLSLNDKKTRMAGRGSQQRVTGLVVNVQAAPPRKERRRIRAIFDQASKDPVAFTKRASELGGYIGYLKQFPQFMETELIARYETILTRIRIIRRMRAVRKRALSAATGKME